MPVQTFRFAINAVQFVMMISIYGRHDSIAKSVLFGSTVLAITRLAYRISKVIARSQLLKHSVCPVHVMLAVSHRATPAQERVGGKGVG